ncbi:MAG: hypothetical protein ACJ76I_09670 [Gaiellaceae bacterium]
MAELLGVATEAAAAEYDAVIVGASRRNTGRTQKQITEGPNSVFTLG